MRKMITSKKELQLIDMTEEIFESGVWVINSGLTSNSKVLKDLVVGYQYKIYLNIKGTSNSIGRIETELGITPDYISFVNTKFVDILANFTTDGASSFRSVITKKDDSSMSFNLWFSGTTTGQVLFRYLITRTKLYW